MAKRRRARTDQWTNGSSSGAAPRLYQRVHDILASHIAGGAVAAGTRLNETAVAAQFGVSRAPARQALAALAGSGLVEKSAGRGYVVRAVAEHAATARLPDGLEDDFRLSSSASWEPIYGEVESELAARVAFASWRVNEAVLARHYGVSRTVARDVMGRLQQHGIVRKDERSRWHAPGLTPARVHELYELRWLLEPVALVKAAPAVPRAFLATMRAHLEDAIANASRIGGATLDRLEEEMHIELIGHCGNATLMQAITFPQSLLIAHRFLYRWTPRLFDAEPFLPEHMEVVRRLERGDAQGAAEALELHLRVSGERATARIDVVLREFQPDDLPYLERLDLE